MSSTTPSRAEVFPGILRAGLVTAVVDGLFASALSVFAYGSTVTRLWQGVASTLLGPGAIGGGPGPAAIGLAMHVGVALGWSAVFMLIVVRSSAVRRVLLSKGGIVRVAAAYGPFIWMVMSLVVIPTLARRPPAITTRWWIQLLGHIPFVAVPIAGMIARSVVRSSPERRG
jgi:hypothetical protein